MPAVTPPKLSIVIISCWYGPYPWYLPYFLYSCKHNRSIDFVIVTDNKEAIPGRPPNVRIHYKTMEQIKTAASAKLKFPVRIDRPYKLNDFKPAFGFIFSSVIQQYDFWACGDIDVVYGSLRTFLTAKILNRYDVLSFRPEYLSGSLTVYRNKKYINELFKTSKDVRKVFSAGTYQNFDECGFLFVPLWNNVPLHMLKSKIQSMTHVVVAANDCKQIKAYFDFNLIEGDIGEVCWKKGRVFYKNRFEVMYYHFLKFKRTCITRNDPGPISNKHEYHFTPTRIYKKQLS